MKLLFAILAVIVMGLMLPTVFAEEKVPSWVKSTAGWWATDNIEESEFISAIQYLIQNEIIQISVIDNSTYGKSITIQEVNSYGFASGESKTKWELPTRANMLELGIAGSVYWDQQTINRLRVDVIFPSGVKSGIVDEQIGTGEFFGTFPITSKSETGKYKINVKFGEREFEIGSFLIVGKNNNIPDWIKNTAKWWSDGNISDQNFLDAIKFLVENGIVVTDGSNVETGSILNLKGLLPIYELEMISDRVNAKGNVRNSNLFAIEEAYMTFEKDDLIYELIISRFSSSEYAESSLREVAVLDGNRMKSGSGDVVFEEPLILCKVYETDPLRRFDIGFGWSCTYENTLTSVILNMDYDSYTPSETAMILQTHAIIFTMENILERTGVDPDDVIIAERLLQKPNEKGIVDGSEGFSSLSCTQNEYGSVVMTGRYTNGPIPYESIYFTLGIEDRNGNIVATGIGGISNVGAYQTKIFEATAGWEYDFENCIIEVKNAYE